MPWNNNSKALIVYQLCYIKELMRLNCILQTRTASVKFRKQNVNNEEHYEFKAQSDVILANMLFALKRNSISCAIVYQ